jgi:hypothetical protein
MIFPCLEAESENIVSIDSSAFALQEHEAADNVRSLAILWPVGRIQVAQRIVHRTFADESRRRGIREIHPFQAG